MPMIEMNYRMRRDYFAAAALQGLLAANPTWIGSAGGIRQELARQARLMADAMIAEFVKEDEDAD